MTDGCDVLRFDLGAYALGGLSDEERGPVDDHLTVCARCRAELGELKATSQLLATLRSPTPPAPADLEHRVLDAHRRRTRRRPTWSVAAALLLTALVGVAAGGALWALQRPPPPDAVLTLPSEDPEALAGEAGLRQTPNGVEVQLALTGVAEADEGYYHLWLHRGDRRVSAGTFVGADGEARGQLLCGGQLGDYDRLTVTWHPFGDPDEVVAVDVELG
jgi:ferric-dicitrate binding protein FerR (iron transport regulator)